MSSVISLSTSFPPGLCPKSTDEVVDVINNKADGEEVKIQ